MPGRKNKRGEGLEQPWQVPRGCPRVGKAQGGVTGLTRGARPCCSLSLSAAPESLSPAGGVGEEAPDEDEDEAEAEDPERPAGASGARGSGGGSGGAGAGGCVGPGGALSRRSVTLRVLLKDAQLEPGAGVLSIYYLVSTPHLPSHPAWGKKGKLRPRASLQQAEPRNGEGKPRHGASRLSTSPEGLEDLVHQIPNSTKKKVRLRGYHCFLGCVTSLNSQYPSILVSSFGKWVFFPLPWGCMKIK